RKCREVARRCNSARCPRVAPTRRGARACGRRARTQMSDAACSSAHSSQQHHQSALFNALCAAGNRASLLPNNASIRPIVSPTLHDLCAGVPIPKFASPCSTLSCELRNQRDTSKLTHSSVVLDLKWFWILKFLGEFAAYL